MNTVEITNVTLQAEENESMPIQFETQQQSTASTRHSRPNSRPDAPVRYALLLIIVVLAGWVGLFVHNAINEINADIQATHENLLSR